jgi:hypothetical protein
VLEIKKERVEHVKREKESLKQIEMLQRKNGLPKTLLTSPKLHNVAQHTTVYSLKPVLDSSGQIKILCLLSTPISEKYFIH